MKQNTVSLFRKHYGLTQQELAHLCNKSRSTIMNWEYGSGCPSLIENVLESILDQKLACNKMVLKMKQVFDKRNIVRSI